MRFIVLLTMTLGCGEAPMESPQLGDLADKDGWTCVDTYDLNGDGQAEQLCRPPRQSPFRYIKVSFVDRSRLVDGRYPLLDRVPLNGFVRGETLLSLAGDGSNDSMRSIRMLESQPCPSGGSTAGFISRRYAFTDEFGGYEQTGGEDDCRCKLWLCTD
jgi:hypothetical protein